MRLRRLRAAAQPVGVWTARHLIARGFKTSQPPIVGDGTKLLPAVHAFIASAVLAGGLLTWQHDLANKDEVAEARLRSDLTALFKTLDLTGDGTLQCGTGEVKRMLRNPEFLLLVSETHIPKEAVFSYLDKDDSGDITLEEFVSGLGDAIIEGRSSKNAAPFRRFELALNGFFESDWQIDTPASRQIIGALGIVVTWAGLWSLVDAYAVCWFLPRGHGRHAAAWQKRPAPTMLGTRRRLGSPVQTASEGLHSHAASARSQVCGREQPADLCRCGDPLLLCQAASTSTKHTPRTTRRRATTRSSGR
jgi:hypothetical protein